MPPSSLPNLSLMILAILLFFNRFISTVQAGNCFYHRTNDLCYDLSEANAAEDQCTGLYYSDDNLEELDGSFYADNCRDVNVVKRCNLNCGLGQECQWIDDTEMCVCSEAQCSSMDVDQQPVCASNNMTFRSKCAMEAWKCLNQRSALYIKYDGQCQKDCRNVRCSHNKVCLLVENTGEPICYPKKHCNPALDPEPVCGTNGVTYSNICNMRLAHDRRGHSPNLAHRGSCASECRPGLCEPHEHCVYSKQSRPVCIRCQYSPTFLRHSGECNANIPICGDDGRVYRNYCSLLLGRCDKRRYIHIIDYGSCPISQRKVRSSNQLDYIDRLARSLMN